MCPSSVTLLAVSSCVRIVTCLLRLFGFGGTALPGLWVERYAPWLIGEYAKHYDTIVLVTGTNGKTTVQLALQRMLEEDRRHLVNNASGSNMLRGIASTVLAAGIPASGSVLLCEVEEATMPHLTRLLRAHIIVITNLYRDQLDAYGELHTTVKYLKDACLENPDATIIFNADDPLVSDACTGLPHKKQSISLGSYASQFAYEGSVPQKTDVTYEAQRIEVQEDLAIHIEVRDNGAERIFEFMFQPPGMYNAYNALAAYAASRALQVEHDTAIKGLEATRPPFGRGERFTVTASDAPLSLRMFLVKNPAGYGQVWSLLQTLTTPFSLVLALNDRVADGTDVSWIWDIRMPPFESGLLQTICCTGTRAHDMALRVKYEGIEGTSFLVEPSLEKALRHMVYHTNAHHPCFVLTTYTAMNELRKHLNQFVTVLPYQT